MASITRVKSAQQRYETVPVLDENGRPVKIALTTKDGQPKMTSGRRGKTPRPVFITKTVTDKTKPKANLRCDFPGCDITGGHILPGQSYMWIKPKSGPYGGQQRNRHQAHRAWYVWEYSYSLSARLAQIEHENGDLSGVESVEDAQAVAEAAADAIRELAEEKRESASNIEDGFGHETYQSEELNQTADDLDSWADEVAETEFPDPEDADFQDQEEVDCSECGASGQVDNPDWDEADEDSPEEVECETCNGTGLVENEDPEIDWDAWREAAQEALNDTLGNCPV